MYSLARWYSFLICHRVLLISCFCIILISCSALVGSTFWRICIMYCTIVGKFGGRGRKIPRLAGKSKPTENYSLFSPVDIAKFGNEAGDLASGRIEISGLRPTNTSVSSNLEWPSFFQYPSAYSGLGRKGPFARMAYQYWSKTVISYTIF